MLSVVVDFFIRLFTPFNHRLCCRTVKSPIVLSDEGDEDEDDTARLSDLISLAEAGLQAEEDKDDTGRLSELIALAEAGLQAKEAEDDTGRLSELIALADAGL